jgi:hypothetical protein
MWQLSYRTGRNIYHAVSVNPRIGHWLSSKVLLFRLHRDDLLAPEGSHRPSRYSQPPVKPARRRPALT